MRVDVKITGVDNVLNVLRSLPPEIVSKRGGPVKAALRKAANVIRDEAKANVRKIVAEPNRSGVDNRSSGELEQSIRSSRGKMPPGVKGEKYIVWTGRVKRRYALYNKDNQRKGRAGAVYYADPPQYYGKFLEFGTSKMRPYPWLRPAVQTKQQIAINTFINELNKRVAIIIKKLEKQGRR